MLDGFDNAGRVAAVREAANDRGLAFGVWQTVPVASIPYQTFADFYVAEGERYTDWKTFAPEFRSWNPSLPAAVITNLDTHGDPRYFHPLIADGWACITECYVSDNPYATPVRMDFEARQRGWERSQPCVSLYAGQNGHPKLADYELDGFDGWSVYLAEYLFV